MSEWEKEKHPTKLNWKSYFPWPIDDDYWKYNPLLYTPAATAKPGENPYEDKRKWKAAKEGLLEPHVFTKFQRFSCGFHQRGINEYIRCEFGGHAQKWTLRDKMETSSLFWTLSQLLSRVQVIKSLEIVIDVEERYRPNSKNVDSKDVIEDRIRREDSPSDQIIRSGLNGFQPWLRKLGNVETFDVKVPTHIFDYRDPTYQKLGEKSGRVVEELEKEVSIKFLYFLI